MKKSLFIIFLSSITSCLSAQTDTASQAIDLNEVVISANKVAESKRNVAQQIRSISSKEISLLNVQNTGDLLSATGLVMVQRSQQGGSSRALRSSVRVSDSARDPRINTTDGVSRAGWFI